MLTCSLCLHPMGDKRPKTDSPDSPPEMIKERLQAIRGAREKKRQKAAEKARRIPNNRNHVISRTKCSDNKLFTRCVSVQDVGMGD